MIGLYFILIAIMFYGIWLKEVLPAILDDTLPKSVSDYNLLVNPIHVLDIAIVLPGLIIAAILLLKKRPLGYILAPVFLVFIVILAGALMGMVFKLKAEGISDETSL